MFKIKKRKLILFYTQTYYTFSLINLKVILHTVKITICKYIFKLNLYFLLR